MTGIIIAAVLAALVLLIIFLPVVAWSLLGFIALVLLVALLVPVGAELSYIGGEFKLSAKISAFTYKILPKEAKPESKEKPKREKKPKADLQTGKPKKKLDLSFDEITELVKKALKGLDKFGKLTVHKFMLHYVAAGKDPYTTAINYNYVNAALSALAPICANTFNVKGGTDVRTDVDFIGEEMLFEAELSITLRLIQVLRVAVVVLFGALGVLIKNKLRLRREKRMAMKDNIIEAPANTTEEKTQANIKTEERMDNNGQ